jgi:hypothetical protein
MSGAPAAVLGFVRDGRAPAIGRAALAADADIPTSPRGRRNARADHFAFAPRRRRGRSHRLNAEMKRAVTAT